MLILKDGASLESIQPSISLAQYIYRNHQGWCRFVSQKVDFPFDPEDVVFVSGVVKTAEWAVAYIADGDSGGWLNVHNTASSWGSALFEHSPEMNVQYRIGSVKTTSEFNDSRVYQSISSAHRDQTIFARFLKIKYRDPNTAEQADIEQDGRRHKADSGAVDDVLNYILSVSVQLFRKLSRLISEI